MRSQVTILAFVLLGLIAGASAQTSAPTLEGVEAQLKAKREQAARDAAALRQKQADVARQAEAKRKADVSARDAQSKRMAEQTARAAEAKRQAATQRGTLVLQSDADCTLVIDGVSQGTLRAGNVRSLEVVPGEQLIACTSSVDPSKNLEATETVLAGQKQVVKLALAALLVPPKSESTAGSVFRAQLKDGGEGPEMVVVPAGSFWMGSPDSEAGRDTDEGPTRAVTLGAFAIGTTELTHADWDRCVAAGGCGGYRPSDQGYGRGNRPVINVSWDDAQLYAQWLSAQTDKRYRLPSEAEWEYAARAGTQSAYWWGDASGSNRANCSGCGSQWDGAQTAPIKSFAKNAFGLFDVHGNAWEWTADCYNASYSGAPSDGSAWQSGDCDRRVLRGGGWSSDPVFLRAAYRDGDARAVRNFNFGFRLIQDL